MIVHARARMSAIDVQWISHFHAVAELAKAVVIYVDGNTVTVEEGCYNWRVYQ